jgi:hypothetical protein
LYEIFVKKKAEGQKDEKELTRLASKALLPRLKAPL